MIVFSNCKLNLGLHVLHKREDGFHNLETVFYPLPFYDVLEVIADDTLTENKLEVFGIELEGDAQHNLCLKAYNILKKDFPQLPFIKIYLLKNIPAGAGLGGGSADGAFMLKLLNEMFDLKITAETLIKYALQLGSDCPFFIINKPCFAQQRGEVLEEVKIDLSGYKIIIINPGIHINTGWAFKQLQPASPAKSIKEILEQPVTSWKNNLKNDFEAGVFTVHPSIQNIKNILYGQGAVYAAMSGSGSTVFGIFKADVNFNAAALPPNFFIKDLKIA